MAEVAAEEAPTDALCVVVAEMHKGGAGFTFLMQAADSVSGALYRWTSVGQADHAGGGYPGPNSPTQIAIAGVTDG